MKAAKVAAPSASAPGSVPPISCSATVTVVTGTGRWLRAHLAVGPGVVPASARGRGGGGTAAAPSIRLVVPSALAQSRRRRVGLDVGRRPALAIRAPGRQHDT